MSIALGLARGLQAAPAAASIVAQSAEPFKGDRPNELAAFTRKQQRTMKLLLLRASRPLLKHSKASPRQTQTSPLPDTVAMPEPPTSTGSDPLPLHALHMYEEARRLEQYEKANKGANPLESAVDWVVDVAQGVSLPRSVLGWLKEEESVKSAAPVTKSVTEDATPCAFVEEDIEELFEDQNVGDLLGVQEQEEATVDSVGVLPKEDITEALYARCDWPRAVAASPVSVSTPSTSAPRCAWPKQSPSHITQHSASAVQEIAYARCAWPRTQNDASVTPVEQEIAYARCAWPRTQNDGSVAPVEPASKDLVSQPEVGIATEDDRASLERIFSAEANVGVPHCSWPRRASLPGQTADAMTANFVGAHSAWPRRGSLVGPHSVWPRKTASIGLTAPEEEEVILGPRCSWPRSGTAVLAPRCNWPSLGAVPKAAEAFAESEVEAPIAAVEVVAEGPRCSWPREAGSSILKAESQTEAIMGPRCPWPRDSTRSA